MTAKRASILKELVPGVQRVAALINMSNPSLPGDWESLEKVAAALGFTATLLDVRQRVDLVPAFERMHAEHADALAVSTDSVTQANRDLIVELAARHKLPTIYVSREFVDAGGLITYGVNYPDLYRRAAIYVDKILKGTKPADIPIEQPSKFELVINLKTAKALGLTIPASILIQADEVIE